MSMLEADTIFDLAVMYLKGDGVEKNISKASDLFLQAAETGHNKAQFNIGVMRLNGIACEKNLAEARDWFTKSAQQGNKQALNALEKMRATASANSSEMLEGKNTHQDVAETKSAGEQQTVNTPQAAVQSPLSLTTSFIISGLLLVFLIYKGMHYFGGGNVDVSKLAQNWECTQVSGGSAKGEISRLNFDGNGRYSSSVVMPNQVKVTISGNYSLTNNNYFVDNLMTDIQSPTFSTVNASKFSISGTITKLDDRNLNMQSKLLGRKVNNPRFNYYECKKIMN